MVAYIMAVFTKFGKDTEFFVRLGGFAASIAALTLLYFTYKTLFPQNDVSAWKLLFIFNITLLFPAGCIVQTPDTPMLLFWSLAIFCGSRIITGGGFWWWYLWGYALGLGLLSKYTMILIVPCTFLFLLLSSQHRFWLFRKEPYLALIIAFFVFSPVLIWNYQNQWVSFTYQLQHGFAPKKRDVIHIVLKMLEYLGGQAAVVTPILFIAFIIYSLKGFIASIKEKIPVYLYLFLLSWPIIIFFGTSTIFGKVAEANWPAPAYIAGFILMCHVYNERFRENSRHRKFFHTGVGLAVVINFMVHAHLITPYLPIPANLDPTAQFRCWKDMGQKINAYVDDSPHKDAYFLLSEKGTTVAEAVFYTGNRFTGLDFSRSERYIFLKDTERLRGKDAVIILHQQGEAAIAPYLPYFESIESIGTHYCVFQSEKVNASELYLYAGRKYNGTWLPFGAEKGRQ